MRVLAALLAFLAQMLVSASPQAQLREPGGTPQDIATAVNQPHAYAWRLFLFLNHQSQDGSAGVADPSKPSVRDYDRDRPVVWETWANATGGLFLAPGELNTSEVYKDRGADPGPWESLPRSQPTVKRLDPNTTTFVANAKRDLLQLGTPSPRGGPTIMSHPAVAVAGEFEVRMNKSTFESIRKHRLYSAEGLIAKFEEAKRNNRIDAIQFELESKEVKAKWIRLPNEEAKLRYHWRTINVRQPDCTTVPEAWGLSGLHIITKDLPQWFWTDFEHVDQEPTAIRDGRPSIDPTTRGPDAKSGRDGVRQETVGSKWQFYRLRGVQLSFFDQFGNALELANTLIEPLSSGPSSCVTCHAKAAVSNRINHKIPGAPFMISSLSPEFVAGAPDPRAFRKDGRPDGEILFLPTDFLWSMAFRARSERTTQQVVVKMSNFAFVPGVIEVNVGDEVVWQNSDAMAHSAKGSQEPRFDTGLIEPGATSKAVVFSQKTGAQGMSYACAPHPFMTGRIVVK